MESEAITHTNVEVVQLQRQGKNAEICTWFEGHHCVVKVLDSSAKQCFGGFWVFFVGKFCASAGVGLLLQQGGPARITVRRHEHARLLTGLEPDYKPSPGRAGRRLCQACALTSRQRCLGGAWAEARSANSSANSSENTVTWPKSHTKSLAEM